MPDQTAESSSTYAEAVTIAAQLGGYASQSTLQRRLRLGYQDAHALQDRLIAEGHLDAQAVATERTEHLQRALISYAQASAATASYEESGVYGIPRNGFSSYQDAAQVAQDAHAAARFYGATAAQLDAADLLRPVISADQGLLRALSNLLASTARYAKARTDSTFGSREHALSMNLALAAQELWDWSQVLDATADDLGRRPAPAPRTPSAPDHAAAPAPRPAPAPAGSEGRRR
ncbi:hypothetical protein ACWGCC_03730 [Streptomyces nigrescens]